MATIIPDGWITPVQAARVWSPVFEARYGTRVTSDRVYKWLKGHTFKIKNAKTGAIYNAVYPPKFRSGSDFVCIGGEAHGTVCHYFLDPSAINRVIEERGQTGRKRRRDAKVDVEQTRGEARAARTAQVRAEAARALQTAVEQGTVIPLRTLVEAGVGRQAEPVEVEQPAAPAQPVQAHSYRAPPPVEVLVGEAESEEIPAGAVETAAMEAAGGDVADIVATVRFGKRDKASTSGYKSPWFGAGPKGSKKVNVAAVAGGRKLTGIQIVMLAARAFEVANGRLPNSTDQYTSDSYALTADDLDGFAAEVAVERALDEAQEAAVDTRRDMRARAEAAGRAAVATPVAPVAPAVTSYRAQLTPDERATEEETDADVDLAEEVEAEGPPADDPESALRDYVTSEWFASVLRKLVRDAGTLGDEPGGLATGLDDAQLHILQRAHLRSTPEGETYNAIIKAWEQPTQVRKDFARGLTNAAQKAGAWRVLPWDIPPVKNADPVALETFHDLVLGLEDEDEKEAKLRASYLSRDLFTASRMKALKSNVGSALRGLA